MHVCLCNQTSDAFRKKNQTSDGIRQRRWWVVVLVLEPILEGKDLRDEYMLGGKNVGI